MDLFDHNLKKQQQLYAPLADRVRPQSLEQYIGQDEIVSDGKALKEMIDSDNIPSLIFWGPPGSGKTTLAKIISNETESHFVPLSAVSSGVKKVKEVCQKAYQDLKFYQKKTILFLDEIHRFNKSQQDAFLPFVEKGIITLIGATTENPSFEINNALLSRCHVFILKKHNEKNIEKILFEALESKNGLVNHKITYEKEAVELLAKIADGDARSALNTLELAANSASQKKDRKITKELITNSIQQRSLIYDKTGEEHYNIISALHKSMRNSDENATLYWLGRMIEGGEDPRYIFRRMIRFASEDIGLADPMAVQHSVSCFQAYELQGLPEGALALAQCALYLARAPKNNELYTAHKEVLRDIKEFGALQVPMQLRNAATKLMKEVGYGEGYKYAHSYEDKKTDMQCMPEKLKNKSYFDKKRSKK